MALNLNTAMDAIGSALANITGLRVHDYVEEWVTPPAAVVDFPDTVEYDHTLMRGKDRAMFQVHLMVAKNSPRAARDELAGYMNGAGTTSNSVKAAVDAIGPHVRVVQARKNVYTIAGVDYLGAVFEVDYVA